MAMYIKKIVLENIRCFEHVEVSLEKNNEPILWSTLLGDNAAGKTTFLRSLAIGLCDESSGAGLLRESEEGYIRRGQQDEGKITLTLRSDNEAKLETTIISTIRNINTPENPIEELSQVVCGEIPRPWDRIFACAYGIGRGSSGSGDLGAYNTISAVYNLFNYSEGLQNPELVILRCLNAKGEKFYNKAIKPLLLRLLPGMTDIHLDVDGIRVDGPWGVRMPLRDLADGYRSTCLWLFDFIGWAVLRAVQSASDLRTEGIVLLDAIEEHLHPKWQRTIVQDLRESFPKTQFIVSTHSPIIAGNSGISPELGSNSKIFHFRKSLKPSSAVTVSEIQEDLDELGYGQILSSDAFDHTSSSNLILPDILTKTSKLAAKENPSEQEKKDLAVLKTFLKEKMFPSGRTYIERVIESEFYAELESKSQELKSLLDKIEND